MIIPRSLQRAFAWGSSLVLVLAVLLVPVGSAFAVSGQPDLTVNSIINVDGALSIKVGNEGTRDAFSSEVESARLYIYVNEVIRRDYLLSQLNSNLIQADNSTVLTPFSFGTTYLPENQINQVRVCVDPTNQVSDSDLTNNCLTQTFLNGQVYNPQPDLKVYFVRNIGGVLSIQVGNSGERNVSATEASNANLTIVIDGTLRRAYQLNQLNSDLLAMNIPPVLTPLAFGTEYLSNNQDHVVRVCVDATNQIAESNEGNNCKTSTLRNNILVVEPELAPADLVVQSISNNNGTLAIQVGNQGELDVSEAQAANATLTIYVNETLRRAYHLTQLNGELRLAGHSTIVTPFNFGTAYLPNNQNNVVRVCVDATNQITESNESNNCKTVALRNNVAVVEPVPTPVYYSDLTVHGVSNSNGTLWIKIGNQGQRDVSTAEASNANLTITIDGTLRRTYQLTQLNAEFLATGNATVLTPFVFGTDYLSNNQNHVVMVCVDATNQITESNESNNCKTSTLRNNVPVAVPVPVKPDLAVASITTSGTDGTKYVQIKVSNYSTTAVEMMPGKSYTFDVYVDGARVYNYQWATLQNRNFTKALWSSVFVPLSQRHPALQSGGVHTIKACVDASNSVDESNESNNCLEERLSFSVTSEPTTPGAIPVPVPTPPAGFEDAIVVATSNSPNPFADTSMMTAEGRAAATLYNNAIIGGYPDGTFGGNRAVNRAEAAKFLLLARYGIIGEYSNSGRFNDILDGQWYVRFVVRAAQLGVIQGYSDGSFRPAAQVNTAEFLKMMSLTFDLPVNLGHSFTDVAAGSWYAPYAGIATQYNLFPNRGNRLSPGALLTRNEVAVAIYQYLVNR